MDGYVSTGNLPPRDEVRQILRVAFDHAAADDRGAVATYIPALARTPADLFGVAVASVNGEVHTLGDSAHEFSIQSVSKPFVFALVAAALGGNEAARRLGTNSTGQAFDSIIAVELDADRVTNPMVNAGAIAATVSSRVRRHATSGSTSFAGLSTFAGRRLTLDEEVYESEAATNGRNRGVAHLLASYGRLYFDADEACDLYTRQCALSCRPRTSR